MKRVSARHQVDGRIGLEAALPLACRSGRRNRFLRSVQVRCSACNFAKASPRWRDLILTCSPTPSLWVSAGRLHAFRPPVFIFLRHDFHNTVRLTASRGRPQGLPPLSLAPVSPARDGYGFAKSYGKPTFAVLKTEAKSVVS